MADIDAISVLEGEGVDTSEGGWATDAAVSCLAFVLIIVAYHHIKPLEGKYYRSGVHFWFFIGTFWAFAWGASAHRWFGNRAADGVGQVMFYITMLLGYCGTYVRISLGLDLPVHFAFMGAFLFLMLFITGIGAMSTMETTSDMNDDVPSGEVKDGYQTAANFDFAFAFVEMLSAFYEIGAFIYWYLNVSIRDRYALAATVLNVAGWSIVYGLGILSTLADFSYDTAFLQRCFHYSQLSLLVVLLAMEKELVDLRNVNYMDIPDPEMDKLDNSIKE